MILWYFYFFIYPSLKFYINLSSLCSHVLMWGIDPDNILTLSFSCQITFFLPSRFHHVLQWPLVSYVFEHCLIYLTFLSLFPVSRLFWLSFSINTPIFPILLAWKISCLLYRITTIMGCLKCGNEAKWISVVKERWPSKSSKIWMIH